MAQRKTLTEKQVALLRWIAEGCPVGVIDDGHFYRIAAAALERRGLVTITGRRERWAARITRAGRDYLARVDAPDPPLAREATGSVTQRLVAEVIAAGGSLRVPNRRWYKRGEIDYARRACLAAQYGRVPAGKRLVVRSVSFDELELELVDAPGHLGGRSELVPIAIPEKVGRYHRVAREFRAAREYHEISRALLRRGVTIVHVIACEAERRGWVLAFENGWFSLEAGAHSFRLRLREEGVYERGAWVEARGRLRYVTLPDGSFGTEPVYPGTTFDAGATGQLRLELPDHVRMFSGRQSRWADRKHWTLEERLPHVFREIEERVIEADRDAEERRIEKERAEEAARRAAEERERMWHVLMARARERLVEVTRAEHLRAQADAWQAATLLRRYITAMERTHGEVPETRRWIEWARSHADQLDPLRRAPSMPADPEPTPEAVQPFLPHGWSSYGPTESVRPVSSREPVLEDSWGQARGWSSRHRLRGG